MKLRTVQLFFIVFIFSLIVSNIVYGQEDENSDLLLIPKAIEDKVSPDKNSALSGKAYIEDAFTGWLNRSTQTVPVPIELPNWQNRTSLDIDYNLQLNQWLKISLSDRLNGYVGNMIPFPSNESAGNDFREAFLTFEPFPMTYLEAGRINLKNGTALGYNPSDFFKTQSSVNIASIDPSAQKENRLGTVMIEDQQIWDNGSLTLAFAPKLQNETQLQTTSISGFNPLFGQTNYTNRFLASLSYDIANMNPKALIFIDNIGAHIGLSLSKVISSSVIAYAEWAGVTEADITNRALTKNTQTLPIGTMIQSNTSAAFQNDLAIGASWTSSSKLTINLEYHYHQSGLNEGDFNRWISLGSSNSTMAEVYWFIRQYAAQQQEPLMQHEFFALFDYPDVIQSKLNLDAVAFISPYDGSILAQESVSYFISRKMTLGVFISESLGSLLSVYGSLPSIMSMALRVVWYI
jgi:hypothetical protein